MYLREDNEFALNGSGIKGERHTCMPIVCFGCNVFEIVKDTCIW